MTLMLALVCEWLVGDPPNRWHPVAWFGRWAQACEARLYRDARSSGVLAWTAAATPAILLAYGAHALFGLVADVVLVWASLGWRSLLAHVRRVLAAESDEEAKRAAWHITSRDVGPMRSEDARRAALESLAENACDAVIAPMFWWLLLGPVGAWGYRIANTLDALWGYRHARYRRFGWWAARVDDFANWMPARITAALFAVVGRTPDWRLLRAQARAHPSVNAGWPEAALAWAAHVRLGGPVRRRGQLEARPFYGPEDARAPSGPAACEAVRCAQRAMLLGAALALGLEAIH